MLNAGGPQSGQHGDSRAVVNSEGWTQSFARTRGRPERSTTYWLRVSVNVNRRVEGKGREKGPRNSLRGHGGHGELNAWAGRPSCQAGKGRPDRQAKEIREMNRTFGGKRLISRISFTCLPRVPRGQDGRSSVAFVVS
jgi:hypothetical protein